MTLKPHESLLNGKYFIERVLGRGGFGLVKGGSGRYFWTVAVVQMEPYQRTGPEGPPRVVQVELGGGGQGGATNTPIVRPKRPYGNPICLRRSHMIHPNMTSGPRGRGAGLLAVVVANVVIAVTFLTTRTQAQPLADAIRGWNTVATTPVVSKAFLPQVRRQVTPTPTPTPTPLIELVGQIGGFIRAVEVQEGYAYVGVGPRLLILNVSNPSHPVLVGQSPVLPTFVESVRVVGDFAYVTKGYGGLQIIDVSNPANPTLRGAYDTPGSARGISVVGSLAYVADGSSLQVIDVSNPANPTLRGAYNTPGNAYGVSVVGSLAYVADGYYSGLQIIDVSNPANPTWRGAYDTPGPAYNVSVVGGLAYVADGYNSGLQIIDVSNPANPTWRGAYDTSGHAYGVSVVGRLIYVADWEDGLLILRWNG